MQKKKLRFILYILTFLFSMQVAIPTYINSSFLELHLPEKAIGFLYTIASLFTILSLLTIPVLLRKIGNFATTLFLVTINIAVALILAFSPNTYLVLSAFILLLVVHTTIGFNLDIFLEKQTDDRNTGNIRGIYMTIANMAWVISPALAGLLLTNGDYWKIYLISSLILLPFLILFSIGFKSFKDPIYNKTLFCKTFRKIHENKNIFKIFMVRSFLQFFYSWMVIYTPIYLHKYIGFEWKMIGIIFTIMLLPFILFELPMGILADKKYGEKEILNLGIVILVISTISLSFINSSLFLIWAGVLFATRIGASFIEIMAESYFFKHVEEKDID
ncbi:MAG: MFS transporter, partial [Candidatus Pacebacteria bacterium]|nr:MFS transporter [Candidatus Paceibacterota bacterium]